MEQFVSDLVADWNMASLASSFKISIFPILVEKSWFRLPILLWNTKDQKLLKRHKIIIKYHKSSSYKLCRWGKIQLTDSAIHSAVSNSMEGKIFF